MKIDLLLDYDFPSFYADTSALGIAGGKNARGSGSPDSKGNLKLKRVGDF